MKKFKKIKRRFSDYICDAIRTHLFELAAVELPEHERPVDIIIIDSMSKTLSEKNDYRELDGQ